MGKVEKFENLVCWQEARELVKQIFRLTSKGKLSKEFTLSNQLKRAALSVMSNIAEGFSRNHKNDFIRFLDYAQSSVQEVKSLLYVTGDSETLTVNQVKELQGRCDKTRALILGLLKHLKNSAVEVSNMARDESTDYRISVEEEMDLPTEWINLAAT